MFFRPVPGEFRVTAREVRALIASSAGGVSPETEALLSYLDYSEGELGYLYVVGFSSSSLLVC